MIIPYDTNTDNADPQQLNVYQNKEEAIMGFTMLPKRTIAQKGCINKLVTFTKDKILRIDHSRGSKKLYEQITNSAKTSISTADAYLNAKENIAYPDHDIAKLVASDYKEQTKRTTSKYQTIAGSEPYADTEKHYGIKISSRDTFDLGILSTYLMHTIYIIYTIYIMNINRIKFKDELKICIIPC